MRNPNKLSCRKISPALTTFAALGLVTAAPSAFAQLPFTPGDLVVSRVSGGGDGNTVLSSAAAGVFLDEYTTAGVFVQTIALPDGTAGAAAPTTGNRFLTDSGSAGSDGALTLSTDGTALTYQGYNAAVGTLTVATTAGLERVVAVINANGAVDTTTALTDAFKANNFRSSALSGNTLYLGGTSTGSPATGGVRSTTVGGTTSTAVETAQNNVRNVNVYNGNVYFSSGSGTNIGVNIINPDNTVTLLASDTTASGGGNNPYDFVFTDPNTLYVADSSKGLVMYTRTGGTGVFSAPTIITGLGTGVGLEGLTGNGQFLYGVTQGTTSSTAPTSLVSYNLATQAFTTLATSATNTAFRGVDFAPTAAPEPSGAVALFIGAGALGLLAARRRSGRKNAV